MKKVIVTGANSFVGSSIVNNLLKEGYFVIAVARRFSRELLEHPNLNKLSIGDYSDYTSKLPEADILIHCAWMGTTSDGRVNEEIHFNNYSESLKMIDNVVTKGVKKVILAGSQAEYGPTNGPIKESNPLNPNTAYGKYKTKLYLDAKEKHPECIIIDARIFSSYGPKQDATNMVAGMIEKMLNGEECLFTPATQLWNYIYIDDVAKLFTAICDDKFDKSDVYNIASNDTRPLKEFILEMKNATNTTSNIVFGAHEYNSSGYVSLEPDISKILEKIGDYRFVKFKDGINEIIKNY